MRTLVVALSVRVYRALLGVRYSRELRGRYGEQMAGLFTDDLMERMRHVGLRGALQAWSRALRDLARPTPGPITDTGGAPRGVGPTGPGGASGAPGGAGVSGLLRGIGEDAGFGWRALRREPSFVATAAIVLGAGIALNAAVFAIVNAYLVRPLPYPEPDRLVTIRSQVGVLRPDTEGILEKAVTWDLDAFTLVGDPRPYLARGAWVTPDFLEVYGVEPAVGRIFTPDEGVPGAASVAVIGYGLWQDRYGGSPDVLGRTFRAFTSDRPDDAETFTIVGVLPPDFWHFNDYTEVLAPLRSDQALYAGRLVPGMTPEAAAATLTDRVLSRGVPVPDGFAVDVQRTHDLHVAEVRPTLVALQLAVLLVFLIACANVAVLLLVRSARREREMGVRQALGAGWTRLARQLVSEGAILAGLAGVVGVALGWGALAAARGAAANTLWRGVPGGADALRMDVTVLAVTLGLCFVTGVAFGLVPLFSAGGRHLASLVDGGRGSTDTPGRRRTRAFMVGAEVALSLALLAGAGLMVQSAMNLQSLDLGFDPQGVIKGQIGLRQASYPEPGDRVQFFDAVRRGVAESPGVTDVGMVSAVPFTWNFNPRGLEGEGGNAAEGVFHIADAGYFRVMDIDVVQGRMFSPDDVLGAPEVVVVSETLARGLWPGQDPVGRRLRVPAGPGGQEPGPWYAVVGVVSDVKKSVTGLDAGDIYWAYEQTASFWMNFVVRTPVGLRDMVTRMEGVATSLDAEVAVSGVRDVDEAVTTAMAPSRFLAALFAVFAGIALVLAVVGLYGVMAYAARQARKDVAIRMALGADSGDVKRMFLRDTAIVLGAGLVVGAVVARALGSALEEQLHGIEPDDPATLVAVATLLALTALAAAWVPVRRAARIEPMRVLRED